MNFPSPEFDEAVAAVCASCSSLCKLDKKNRRREALSATAGYRIGCTLMPAFFKASDSSSAWKEFPTITGMTPLSPAAGPLSRPYFWHSA